MTFAAQLPDPLKRRIRDAIGLLGVEIIARRSNQWLENSPIRTVIDVGANRGQFARTARTMFPKSQIYSFEPLTDCYEEIRRDFAGDPKLQAFNVAIGAEGGSITMHRNQFDASSSMLPTSEAMARDFPFARSASDVTVQVQTLDEACRGLALDPQVLLKIDVQGYEDKVILGATKVLQATAVVIVEVSFEALYTGQPLFDALYRQLTALGFAYHGNFDQIVSPVDGRVLQADAVFLPTAGRDGGAGQPPR